MNRIAGVPGVVALPLLLLLAGISRSVGRPLGPGADGRSSISGHATRNGDDSSNARGSSEVRDLMSAGNTPGRIVNDKKRMKNTAGKSDEGGFYKTYGSDAEGEKGYLRQTYSKGDHGYKTLDTFHKKDGDNYGFEEHTAFGKARGGDRAGKAGASGSYTTKGNDAADHEGAGTVVDTHYVAEGGDKEKGEEGAESSESTSYSDDAGDDGGHYSGEYSEGDSDGGNYGNTDGYNENYSRGGGDEGSYGSSSSYSHNGDGGGEFY